MRQRKIDSFPHVSESKKTGMERERARKSTQQWIFGTKTFLFGELSVTNGSDISKWVLMQNFIIAFASHFASKNKSQKWFTRRTFSNTWMVGNPFEWSSQTSDHWPNVFFSASKNKLKSQLICGSESRASLFINKPTNYKWNSCPKLVTFLHHH